MIRNNDREVGKSENQTRRHKKVIITIKSLREKSDADAKEDDEDKDVVAVVLDEVFHNLDL